MKLNLPVPGNASQRLLFTNTYRGNKENEFYLLMTFHKSLKGGFDYPVTVEECRKALAKKKCVYAELEYIKEGGD